ncbi:MAG: type II toxin-antitoxin system RelE/ParE family toxin [Bacteroidales bacterium]|nr:type II toxin-antitoxin system RelE/ParE family toxin [Bacteroidales bacterium]
MLFNGFTKKTQKTPPKEIERALRIMKEYYESKRDGK